jgi:hypothetical protein
MGGNGDRLLRADERYFSEEHIIRRVIIISHSAIEGKERLSILEHAAYILQ